ncbi:MULTISPECIES: metal-sulfur cluster assembly factor [unclassified Aeromicrobium]|uniref:metal-sulfur cluster assembly factor n=1 Tax=unclassified Aeromicrobium TaxID=2633570 RepID=UPI0009E842E8|nr:MULTISPECIES: metal-sulfur cluster assembly factor [unclassified Aeromicrobium]
MSAAGSRLPATSGTAADAVAVALRDVPDPCMVAAGAPTSIVDLGLVDAVDVVDGCARVVVTLTEPGCPFTHHIIEEVTEAALAIDGVSSVEVSPRWAPLWTEARATAEGRRTLDLARARIGGPRP